MNNEKAFTLVELIGVITILALLLILLLPNITGVANTSKVTLRDSKIKTIVTAGEKYGNDLINRYQDCLGSPGERCMVSIDKLVLNGYLEADKTGKVVDPTTNTEMNGKVLLCYNPIDVDVYAYYVEEGQTQECKEISLTSGNTLNLSSIGGEGYIGGNPVEVNILKSGNFTNFSCSVSNTSLVTKCTIENDKLKIYMSNNRSINVGTYKEVEVTLTGTYDSGNTMSKVYKMKVYPTNLGIHAEDGTCLKLGETEQLELERLNAGTLSVESNNINILEGTAINGILNISSKNQAGLARVKVKESNGNNEASISRNVYDLKVEDISEEAVLGNTRTYNIDYLGTGNVTISSSPPGILSFSTSKIAAADSITLTDEKSFNIIPQKIGKTTMIIKGSTCGEYRKEINVTNINLGLYSGVVYLNGSVLSTHIDVETSNDLTCTSSNPKAASCTIDENILNVIPEKEEDKNVTISVKGSGGAVQMKVQVLNTSIAPYDRYGNKLNNVCNEGGTGQNDKDVIIRGENMGKTIIANSGANASDEAYDWYLAEVDIAPNGSERLITVLENRIIGTGESPGGNYKENTFNTGRTPIYIKEQNGNKITQFYYNIFSLETESVPTEISAGDTVSLKVTSQATGNITVSSSNEKVASVSVENPSNYNYGVNTPNISTIKITGISAGTVRIVISGTECGSKTYTIRVKGQSRFVNINLGTYTSGVEDNIKTLACSTSTLNASCEVRLPEIYTSTEFNVVGYSETKDSIVAEYRPGDTLTISQENNGKTLFANSADITLPTCSLPASITNTVIGNTTYLTMTCIDTGSGVNNERSINEEDITMTDSQMGEIVSIGEPVEIENGYSYQIGILSKKPGYFEISIKEGTIEDKFGNKSKSISSSILVGEYDVLNTWYIGKDELNDVVAVLYDNENIDGGTPGTYSLYIYGNGDMLDFIEDDLIYVPWDEQYKSGIQNVVINEGVTNVGIGVFYLMSNLKNISLPKGITYIGKFALQGTGISSIELPSGLTRIGEQAFADSSLTSVTMPSTLKEIAGYAFYENTNLTSLNLNKGLETIGDGAFANHKISNLSIPETVTSIGDFAFTSDYNDPVLEQLTFNGSQLTSIGEGAFENHMLKNLTIPASVVSIADFAFAQVDYYDYSTLWDLTFEYDSVLETIGNSAFSGARLSSLVLPNSVKSIGDFAFDGLREGATSVRIGVNVEHFGDSAISGDELREFIVDNDNPHYKSIDGVIYSKDGKVLVNVPDKYVNVSTILNVPNTVETLAPSAFAGWYSHGTSIAGVEVNLPSSITELNIETNFVGFTASKINFDNAQYTSVDGVLMSKDKKTAYRFPLAYNGTSYTLPDTVETVIDDFAYAASNVSTMNVPSSVTVLGKNAFQADPSFGLGTIYLNTSDSVTFDETTFDVISSDKSQSIDSKSRTIYVKTEELEMRISEMYQEADYILNVIRN